jgi:hypothetical protein
MSKMNKSLSFASAVLMTSFFGCAAPDQESAPSDELSSTQQDLTVEECRAQQDKCFRNNPLFGLFTCPAQYTQCVASAENGIPAEVASAVGAAAECTEAAVDCIAKNPGGATGCAAEEAECVAAIVGVELPAVVDGTAACVDGAVECIEGARRVRDLTACATTLSDCAVEQAVSIIPEEVGEVIGGANKCRIELDACVAAAGSAAEIAQCTEDSASCVAATLDVQLPEVPLSEVVDCAEQATTCALDVRRISDVLECADSLRECAGEVAAGVVEGVPAPQQLTCEQKWTACVTRNPFGFFTCGAELSGCKD